LVDICTVSRILDLDFIVGLYFSIIVLLYSVLLTVINVQNRSLYAS